MSHPDYLNYNSTPGVAMPATIIPKVYYPEQDNYNSNGDRLTRFKISKENAFWDPYTAYFKVSVQPLSGKVPSTPGNFLVDVQTSNLELLNATTSTIYDLQGYQNILEPRSQSFISTLGCSTQTNTTYTEFFANAQSKNIKSSDTGLQLDGSIQSIFSEFIVSQGSNIIEEKKENDVITQWLRDMSFTPHEQYSKNYMGINSIHGIMADYQATNTCINSGISQSQYPNLLAGSKLSLDRQIGNYNPTQQSLNIGNSPTNPNIANPLVPPNFIYAKTAWLSMMFSVPFTVNKIQEINKLFSPINNQILDGKYVDYAFNLTWDDSAAMLPSEPVAAGGFQINTNYGSDNSYSEQFSLGANEFMFTNSPIVNFLKGGVPITIYNQQFNQSNTGIVNCDFVLPFLSDLLGIMMPMDRFKMMPMHGLDKFMIEVRQNPNAFFTTYFGANPMDTMFQFKQIELHVNIVKFNDAALNNAIIKTLFEGSGIHISSCSWVWCRTFPIQNGQIQNELLINNKFNSMKMVLFGILSNDYKDYTCYRKSFRLSHCITQLQLRFGQTYIPSLPIKGNSSTNLGTNNNYEFYYNLLMLFGKHLDPKGILINPSNYAIDDRIMYFNQVDVNNVQSIIKQLKLDYDYAGILAALCSSIDSRNQGSLETGFAVNYAILNPEFRIPGTDELVLLQDQIDYSKALNLQQAVQQQLNIGHQTKTAFKCCGNSQLINYYENRFIGKALYGFDMEQSNYDEGLISGFSTEPYAPWSIEIKQGETPSQYARDSSLYVFAYVDVSYHFMGNKIIRNGII